MSESIDKGSPFLFTTRENKIDTINELEVVDFSAATSPTPSNQQERRRTYEMKRAVTETSIERYVGNYSYIIGQSKYYNNKKHSDDVILGDEIGEFFSQQLKDPDTGTPRPPSTAGGSYLTVSSTQKSHDYLKAQMTSIVQQFTDVKSLTRDHYDILGVSTPRDITENNEPEYLASSILNALTQMQAKKTPPTLSFPTNVRFFNLIVYFKDVPDELDADVRLPQTAIPILGNTLKELIITNKSWIITDGSKQPFANMLGDALSKANKREKELTESLRKRLHLTGFISHRRDDKGKRREIAFDNLDPPSDLSPLTMREQKQMDEVINPYTGMSIWLALAEFKDPYLKEKVIWHISQLLRIPAIMVQLDYSGRDLGVGQMFMTSSLRVEVLCPMRDSCIKSWTAKFNLQSKLVTLQTMILRMANSYFENPETDFKQWNTITPSIFLQSPRLVNERLNNFNLELEEYKQPVHAKIIDRTIRYALIFGNREVVETIVNNPIFQKIVIKRRDKIVDDLYQKAAQEVYFFSRVILVIEGPNFKFSNDYRGVKNFLQKFFEMIFGGGFIWETPSENVPLAASRDIDDFDEEEIPQPVKAGDEERKIIKRASEYYFSEYVFVWALICLKFDVAELFLEYSGVQKQDFDQGEVYQTNKGIFQIGNALAASKILTGMSKILKEDTSVSKEEHETINEHASKYESIAIGLLNEALKHGANLKDIFEQKLPFWNDITVIDLAQQARLSSFFSERSITRHVNNEWQGLNNLSIKSDKDFNLWVETGSSLKTFWKPESIKFLLGRIITPRNTFFLHVTFYILFLFMLTLLICFYWRDDAQLERDVIFSVYIVYVVTNYVDEIYQYNSFLSQKYKNKRECDKGKWDKFKENVRIFKAAFVEYLSSIWNLLDIIIVIGFIISVVTYFIFRESGTTFQFVRIYFGLFSTLFYIRFFQYILIFPGIGPLVYTCLLAFKRMLYFLVIIILVAFCFGIAVVALTENSYMTDDESITRRFVVFLFYPYFQLFGEYFLEDFDADNFILISLPNNTRIDIFGSESAATFWLTTQSLTYIGIIVWLLIANVLLLNLMIAYFSQIYEDVSKNADSIYLLNFLEIVEEYREKSFLPAPFNLIIYTLRMVRWCLSLRKRKSKATSHQEEKRRQTEMFKGMKSKRLFITKAVSFGWHIELTFADYYWKKVGEERYAAKADNERDEKMVEEYLEDQRACEGIFV
ncbi:Transient receptor potential cation channel [Oopsacas minuta]|uniref:Transient receptor potential cation channel n=1 Tax=Oopsacas minuta TaxID=111878 RepID=A0AAV7KEV8_9METZ|nr:Transient receptor potential cation channel [Oopsacas minuta]